MNNLKLTTITIPVRQWVLSVLSVPKRLCYFLQTDAALQGAVLRIFLRGVERCLREHSPGCCTSARLGAVAFIHRFGSSLNEHVHFHCCIIDGVFDPQPTKRQVRPFMRRPGLMQSRLPMCKRWCGGAFSEPSSVAARSARTTLT